MIAVIFAKARAQERISGYCAAQLRPILEKIDGFISIERFASLTEPGKILSLSFFRNEGRGAGVARNDEHRLAQAKGRRWGTHGGF
jgi:heme-degrading monooxygenase HmoA